MRRLSSWGPGVAAALLVFVPALSTLSFPDSVLASLSSRAVGFTISELWLLVFFIPGAAGVLWLNGTRQPRPLLSQALVASGLALIGWNFVHLARVVLSFPEPPSDLTGSWTAAGLKVLFAGAAALVVAALSRRFGRLTCPACSSDFVLTFARYVRAPHGRLPCPICAAPLRMRHRWFYWLWLVSFTVGGVTILAATVDLAGLSWGLAGFLTWLVLGLLGDWLIERHFARLAPAASWAAQQAHLADAQAVD